MMRDEIPQHFYPLDNTDDIFVHFAASKVKAGFPSPAMNDLDDKISLVKLLIPHPSTTFFARVEGNSMIGAGISDGDIAVIDKSIEPTDGKIAMAYVGGEFTLKRLRVEKKSRTVWLVAENEAFPDIKITEDNDNFFVWGMLIHVIKSY